MKNLDLQLQKLSINLDDYKMPFNNNVDYYYSFIIFDILKNLQLDCNYLSVPNINPNQCENIINEVFEIEENIKLLLVKINTLKSELKNRKKPFLSSEKKFNEKNKIIQIVIEEHEKEKSELEIILKNKQVVKQNCIKEIENKKLESELIRKKYEEDKIIFEKEKNNKITFFAKQLFLPPEYVKSSSFLECKNYFVDFVENTSIGADLFLSIGWEYAAFIATELVYKYEEWNECFDKVSLKNNEVECETLNNALFSFIGLFVEMTACHINDITYTISDPRVPETLRNIDINWPNYLIICYLYYFTTRHYGDNLEKNKTFIHLNIIIEKGLLLAKSNNDQEKYDFWLDLKNNLDLD